MRLPPIGPTAVRCHVKRRSQSSGRIAGCGSTRASWTLFWLSMTPCKRRSRPSTRQSARLTRAGFLTRWVDSPSPPGYNEADRRVFGSSHSTQEVILMAIPAAPTPLEDDISLYSSHEEHDVPEGSLHHRWCNYLYNVLRALFIQWFVSG